VSPLSSWSLRSSSSNNNKSARASVRVGRGQVSIARQRESREFRTRAGLSIDIREPSDVLLVSYGQRALLIRSHAFATSRCAAIAIAT
jgi:hypothetical protein